MSEDADIEILPPEVIETDTKLPKRFGVPMLIVTAFLASALGAGSMFAVSEMLKKPASNLAPLRANIETLSAENKTLKAQIARLQRDIKAIPKPAPVNLSGLENRLTLLEEAELKEIDLDLVARLEALKEDGSKALDLSDILARLEALETRPTAAMPVIIAAEGPENLIIAPFPKEAVLAALDASKTSGGWLKKSLKKHISVQSEDNPRFLAEQVENHMTAGDIDAAIAAFDKLPVEAKAEAKEWRASLESN